MRWLFIVLAFFAVVIIGISVYLQPNDLIPCGTQPDASGDCRKADAVVVVSGGDTDARTEAGVHLYQNGWADTIIFSGAAQDKTGPSNARAMKRQAIQSGVPESNIFIEEDSVNTQQNAEKTRKILSDNNIKRVLLVTSGYHQRRAYLEFQHMSEGTIEVLNRPVEQDHDWGWYWWLTPRGWWLAGGELVKIGAFYSGVQSR